MEGFRINLKPFLNLAMHNQYYQEADFGVTNFWQKTLSLHDPTTISYCMIQFVLQRRLTYISKSLTFTPVNILKDRLLFTPHLNTSLSWKIA